MSDIGLIMNGLLGVLLIGALALGWRLEGRPGSWKWIAPAHPKSAQYIARARKLAATKGKVFVQKDRNRPKRT